MPAPTPSIPKELSWKAPSHDQAPRSQAWYIWFTLFSIAGLAFAIFYDRSILTIITFVVIILVVLVMSFQPAREITYKISPLGITAGRMVYSFKTIKIFWIDYRPPEIKTLNFETTAYINNQITVGLGNQDPVAIKLLLKRYLPEDLNREESLSEVLARQLKI